MEKHWFLVAHRAGARIFEQVGVSPELTIVHRFENDQGKLKTSELVSDRQGRSDRGGTPGHTALGSDDGQRDHLLQTFVDEVCKQLEHNVSSKAFDSLTIVAESHVLGALKKTLGKLTTLKIRETLSKDFVHVSDNDMAKQLAPQLVSREEIRA